MEEEAPPPPARSGCPRTRHGTALHSLTESLSPLSHSGPAIADAVVAAWRATTAAARAATPRPPHRRPVIDPDATYETLLMRKEAFPVPIPLDVSC